MRSNFLNRFFMFLPLLLCLVYQKKKKKRIYESSLKLMPFTGNRWENRERSIKIRRERCQSFVNMSITKSYLVPFSFFLPYIRQVQRRKTHQSDFKSSLPPSTTQNITLETETEVIIVFSFRVRAREKKKCLLIMNSVSTELLWIKMSERKEHILESKWLINKIIA